MATHDLSQQQAVAAGSRQNARTLDLLPTATACCLLFLTLSLHAQDGIFGRWVTIDDNTGEQRSIVEITSRDSKAYGRVVRTFPEPGDELDPICDECDPNDDRYNKKILGMEIMRDLEEDGDEWNDGTILDPESGTVYDCKVWVEEGKLKVRGYLLFFFRTQTWVREQPERQSKF